MNLKIRALVAVPAALAVCAFVFAVGCHNYGEDGKPEEIPPATGKIRWLSAGGSTFIEPLIDRWDSDYGKSHPLHINYLPVGSGAGIDRLRKGYGSFAASDAPLVDDQLQGLPPIVQFPVTAGPVCVTYNLPGLKVPLRLSSKTLAGIYAGDIVSWQDPAIARDNPGSALPHAPVIVVHRSDGSGTTAIFTNYLSKVSPTWKAKTGLASQSTGRKDLGQTVAMLFSVRSREASGRLAISN